MSVLDDIRDVLDRSRALLLVSHVNPDGDTIGAALGLAWALRSRGKVARVSCADPLTPGLLLMPGAEEFAPRTLTDEDCVVAIDTADIQRLGSVYDAERFARVPLVVIDHHITNSRFGAVNFVEDRSSTAELVLDLIHHMGIPLDRTMATCLMTGLVTDTQSFRTTSTTAQSFEAAVALIEVGVDLPRIMDAAFKQRTVGSLSVWGEALCRAQFERGVLWTVVSREMLSGNGHRDDTVSGLVNFMATVDEARIAAVFHERPGGEVEVGLRSVPGVDVAVIAKRFGGGGHVQASGFTMAGTLDEVAATVVPALREAAEGDGLGAER